MGKTSLPIVVSGGRKNGICDIALIVDLTAALPISLGYSHRHMIGD